MEPQDPLFQRKCVRVWEEFWDHSWLALSNRVKVGVVRANRFTFSPKSAWNRVRKERELAKRSITISPFSPPTSWGPVPAPSQYKSGRAGWKGCQLPVHSLPHYLGRSSPWAPSGVGETLQQEAASFPAVSQAPPIYPQQPPQAFFSCSR